MSPTAMRESYREPTQPPVIPRHFGAGSRLPDLPLMPSTGGPVLPCDDPGIDGLRAQPGQHGLQTGCAREGANFDSLDAPSLVMFFALARGPSLWPAPHGTRRTTLCTASRSRGTTSKRLQESCRIAHRGIREHRGHRPGTQTVLGVLDEGLGRLVRALAHDETPDACAVRRHGRVVPQSASHLVLVVLAPRRLFVTQLHCASHSRACGVRPCTC